MTNTGPGNLNRGKYSTCDPQDRNQDNHPREHFLRMGKKNNKTRIATLNTDNLRTRESISHMAQLLFEKKISIARIQETHNERTDTHEEMII